MNHEDLILCADAIASDLRKNLTPTVADIDFLARSIGKRLIEVGFDDPRFADQVDSIQGLKSRSGKLYEGLEGRVSALELREAERQRDGYRAALYDFRDKVAAFLEDIGRIMED